MNYPRLPNGVENLLALHGLEATAESQGWNKRGNRKWLWKVTKAIEPEVTTVTKNINGVLVHNVCQKPAKWYMSTNDGLQPWIHIVAVYASDGAVLSPTWPEKSMEYQVFNAQLATGRWPSNRYHKG